MTAGCAALGLAAAPCLWSLMAYTDACNTEAYLRSLEKHMCEHLVLFSPFSASD